jgi:hypothetical protein
MTRRMRLSLLLLALATAVPARGEDVPLAKRDIQYFTYFGEQVLRRADFIAIAHVERVTHGGPGTDVVRLTVSEVLKGDRERKEILVLSSRGDFFPGVDMLIFVEPYRNGRLSTYLGRVSKSDPDFAAKLKALGDYLALEHLPDDAARARRVREIMLRNLESQDDWTRWNALRELGYFARDHADLLMASDLDKISSIETAAAEGAFKKALGNLMKRLPARERKMG